MIVTLTGVRQPIVAILLLMSFFTVISGKPVDGLLLLLVATALSWDAGMNARELKAISAAQRTWVGSNGQAQLASLVWEPDDRQPAAWRPMTSRPGSRVIAAGVTGSVLYALIVGSFSRYSWPATAGVAGLGASVVVLSWGGPIRERDVPGKFGRLGVTTWSTVLVAGGLWELSALLMQPNIETSSYAHPTISTLTDPLLASGFGRAFALLAWITFGVWLVER